MRALPVVRAAKFAAAEVNMYSEKESAEVTVNNFLTKIKHYYHPTEEAAILEAFSVAKNAHEGQFRASGRPYITHPTIVADILVDMGFDVPTICAALLHDTVEDCSDKTSLDQIRKLFGEEVALLVDVVTKILQVQVEDKEEAHIENIRKMLLAMTKDIRVIFIKGLQLAPGLQYKTC